MSFVFLIEHIEPVQYHMTVRLLLLCGSYRETDAVERSQNERTYRMENGYAMSTLEYYGCCRHLYRFYTMPPPYPRSNAYMSG